MSAGTWRHAAGVIRANPRSFFASVGFYVAYFTLVLAPGLINRAIFDALSGRGPAGVNVWSLIGLWFAAQLFPLVACYFAVWIFQTFTTLSRVMVRTDMLGWLMFAVGPRKSRGTAGEVLSRFRDDVTGHAARAVLTDARQV